MCRRLRASIALLLVFPLCFFPACQQQSASAPQKPAQATQAEQAEKAPEAPAITTVTAPNIEMLLQQARGKTVVLNLWATWCPPCVAEMPHFVELYRQMDQDVRILSLSADDKSTIDSHVRPFQQEKSLPFPIYVLDDDPEKLAEALKTPVSGALPMTIIYGPDGAVKQVWEEPVTLEQLQQAI